MRQLKMSESNRWFREKWDRLDKLKIIEDNWFRIFNDNVEDEILEKYNEIEKKYFGKSRKSK